MSKLEDILDTIDLDRYYAECVVGQEEARNAIKDLFIELIGEDELQSPTIRTLHNFGIESRNNLRAELRQKVQSL